MVCGESLYPPKQLLTFFCQQLQAKLYLSIIDDVIDSMRELFLDEGLEDRVLDDLRHLWESKMMQSKAMEDFRQNNINSSNFVLQLPASYNQSDQELTGDPILLETYRLTSKTSSFFTLATFSLPAALAYPVQIPAGVTLQTASGQLYKVNVPVVVTQAPAGQQPVSHPTQKVTERREAPASHPAAVQPHPILPHEVEPSSLPASSVTQPKTSLAPSQESCLPQLSPEPEGTLAETELSPQPEPVNLSMTQLVPLQLQLSERCHGLTVNFLLAFPAKLDLDYSYSVLSDIVQLDGPADNSDLEEGDGVPLEENDFLGIINAEAIKALQEGNGSSDGNSISSSSDSEGADDLADVEEEDPLNSGDDVIEQDIPDLFDTDNVIVCQYDKIHRSKNRWKFHLKDGVMCYRGRDYVFSKAVGEAEW
uniref:General transcription factor IIA, 1-like n=1 Tax=Acanthochromis polyacanthus TaxID=80966 RepID=A0A3Q1FPF8_9TELE